MGEKKDSKDRRHAWPDSLRGWFHWREFQNYLEGEARRNRYREEKQPQTGSLVAWVEFGAHVMKVGSLGVRCWNVGQPGDTHLQCQPARWWGPQAQDQPGPVRKKNTIEKKVEVLSEFSTLGSQLLLICYTVKTFSLSFPSRGWLYYSDDWKVGIIAQGYYYVCGFLYSLEVTFKKFLGNNQHAVCAPLLLITSLSMGPLISWRSFCHHRERMVCLIVFFLLGWSWSFLIAEMLNAPSHSGSFPTRLLTTFSSSVKAPRSPPLPFLIFHIGISGFGRYLYRKEFRFLSPGTKNWTETHKSEQQRTFIRERFSFEGAGRWGTGREKVQKLQWQRLCKDKGFHATRHWILGSFA